MVFSSCEGAAHAEQVTPIPNLPERERGVTGAAAPGRRCRRCAEQRRVRKQTCHAKKAGETPAVSPY
jgi:hypothetical protein